MSDTCYSAVSNSKLSNLIDVIDEDWILDKLNEEEFDFPKSNRELEDDNEDDEIEENAWDDQGVDMFEQNAQQLTQIHEQLQTSGNVSNNSNNNSS